MRRTFGVLLVLLAIASATAKCGKAGATVAAWLGATDKPHPAPLAIDILCDASSGSTCTAEALRGVVEAKLRTAASHPGSVVRLWMQGRNIETTRVVASAKSSAHRAAGRHVRVAAENRWIAKECAAFSAAASAPRKRIRRSPIAESIGVIALASPPAGSTREIVVVTDALETSAFGQFECGRLPKPERFARTLAAQHVLPPASLQGVNVMFCHVDLGAIDGDRCAVSLSRAAEVRVIWRAALSAAGASTVEFRQGGLDSTTTTIGKESTDAQTIQSK